MNPVQGQETGALPQNLLTSARTVIPTENGLVNKEAVKRIMQANIPHDAPTINMISSNQS